MRFLVAILLCLAGPAAAAVECRDLKVESNRYTICEVDMTREDMRLFLRGSEGKVLGQFSRVNDALGPEGLSLKFAMNAGMYHADRAPVGYYHENGQTAQPLLTGRSQGNFGLLPNGVFCIGKGRADVVETLSFKRRQPECRYASQSGPMLVIDGALHPRFLVDSDSRHIRNGVGTSTDGKRVVFAISNNRVTFHEFGRLFRDTLGLPQALYFDGSVSRIHAPMLNRSDPGFGMGPIVGVVGRD